MAIEKRGLPKALYVDNGAVFISNQLGLICARLGIRRILATPGEPAGRGKIERFFRTVRSQFLTEVEVEGVASLGELNASFIAWLEVEYHRRIHSETKQTPLERFTDSFTPQVPDPVTLYRAFLWEEERAVAKSATVQVAGNRYEVDAHLVGRKVTLKFDPFDLSRIEVFFRGEPFGEAKPHIIKTFTHPQARKPIEKNAPKTVHRLPGGLKGPRGRALPANPLPRTVGGGRKGCMRAITGLPKPLLPRIFRPRSYSTTISTRRRSQDFPTS